MTVINHVENGAGEIVWEMYFDYQQEKKNQLICEPTFLIGIEVNDAMGVLSNWFNYVTHVNLTLM